MPKKKKEPPPAWCGKCMGMVDREAVSKALRENAEYVHPPCGRVLVRAR